MFLGASTRFFFTGDAHLLSFKLTRIDMKYPGVHCPFVGRTFFPTLTCTSLGERSRAISQVASRRGEFCRSVSTDFVELYLDECQRVESTRIHAVVESPQPSYELQTWGLDV